MNINEGQIAISRYDLWFGAMFTKNCQEEIEDEEEEEFNGFKVNLPTENTILLP